MKNLLSIITLFVSICINGNLQAQSSKQALCIGSWAPSIPLQVLEKDDSLTMDKKAGEGYGYLKFLSDSALRICQSQHHCVRMNNNGYAMKLDYRWYKFGSWEIKGNYLEFNLEAKRIMCIIYNKDSTKFNLRVKSVTER